MSSNRTGTARSGRLTTTEETSPGPAAWSERARVYFGDHAIDGRVAVAAGVRERDGALVFRYEPREGAPFERRRPLNGKATYQPEGIPLALWWPLGVPGPGEAPIVLACEGEADALAALSALCSRNGDDRAQEILSKTAPQVAAIPGATFPVARLVEELVALGTREVFLAYDADEDGDKATARATEALHDAGIAARRVPLPEGSDVADCLVAAEDRAWWLADALLEAEVSHEEEPGPEPGAEEWPPLATSALPAFPVDALPDAVRNWASATAEATQTPIDLAACAALGVLSACVAGGVVIEVEQGWREECCLYVVCALESGERKSAVLRGATAPLRKVEHARMEEARPHVAEAKARREATEQRRRRLTADAARADSTSEREARTNEAATLAVELAAEDEPHVPRLLADDATPEALGGLLARYGQIAVVAAESAFLDNLAGRYAEGRANLHLACQAYSGEPTTIDRRSREPERLDRPLLTLALCVQPFVLARLVTDPLARGQGFVARCLVASPATLLGHRRISTAPVPEETSRAWAELVERVAEMPQTRDRSDTTDLRGEVLSLVSRILGLSHDAHDLLAKLREKHEPRLRDDGDLRPIADWQSRHVGRIVRIAALLHLAANEPGDEIGADTMRCALRIGDWSLAHALDVLTGADPEIRRALGWLRRNGEAEVALRDLQRGLHVDTSDETAALVARLETHGVLCALEAPPMGEQGGRPPSPRYAVHPDLRRTT